MAKKKKADEPKFIVDLPREFFELMLKHDPWNRDYFERWARQAAQEYNEKLQARMEKAWPKK